MNFQPAKLFVGASCLAWVAGFQADAWAYESHRTVNSMALASLPTNFPALALTPEARERSGFLAGETDRWHHATSTEDGPVPALGHASGPDHFTTSPGFHAWIDGGFFHTAVDFIARQNQLVKPLCELAREGKLSNKENRGAAGRAFLEAQLVKSGQLLGDLWLTAPEDTFLERQLPERSPAAAEKK